MGSALSHEAPPPVPSFDRKHYSASETSYQRQLREYNASRKSQATQNTYDYNRTSTVYPNAHASTSANSTANYWDDDMRAYYARLAAKEPPSPPSVLGHEYYRKLARDSATLQKQYSAQSQAAYKSRNGAQAKELSMKAKAHWSKMNEYNELAKNAAFEANNKSHSRDFMDLHDLYVSEAIELVTKRLEEFVKNEDTQLTIIVGQGNNSKDGVAKIKPAVTQLVKKFQVKVTLDKPNKGCILVEALSEEARAKGTHSRTKSNPERISALPTAPEVRVRSTTLTSAYYGDDHDNDWSSNYLTSVTRDRSRLDVYGMPLASEASVRTTSMTSRPASSSYSPYSAYSASQAPARTTTSTTYPDRYGQERSRVYATPTTPKNEQGFLGWLVSAIFGSS
ncbi:hypothetical protein BGZ99_006761 [Dissophora globulifera]|uniref:Smr domain-containing protein n=1 Tax=Dissophora globulifera TaxID=979702 RepID=A0A9P6RBB0_9FUNG|nr:hypothetical protein BGZ99_006761 [Dissophora globulifera]